MIDLLKKEIAKISDMDISNVKGDERIENIGLNSFEMICLISNLSEELKIDIPVGDIANLDTVDDFIKYLEEKKN